MRESKKVIMNPEINKRLLIRRISSPISLNANLSDISDVKTHDIYDEYPEV